MLADLFVHGLRFLLSFIGKADQVAGPVVLAIGDSGYGVSITDSKALVSHADNPTATFAGPLEAAVRLLAGRLRPEHTPSGLTVTGNALPTCALSSRVSKPGSTCVQ